jgi:hypothetical protein
MNADGSFVVLVMKMGRFSFFFFFFGWREIVPELLTDASFVNHGA